VAALLRDLDGVLQQIAGHLRKTRGIALHQKRLFRQHEIQCQLSLFQKMVVVLDRLPDEAHQIERLLRQLDLAARNSRNVEEIVEQPGLVGDFAGSRMRLRPPSRG
jgi:hypothetical protein